MYLNTLSLRTAKDKYYIECIRDLLVVRDVIRPSLFNQGLKLGESKSFRGFDAWIGVRKHCLSASCPLGGMNACMFCNIGNIRDVPQRPQGVNLLLA